MGRGGSETRGGGRGARGEGERDLVREKHIETDMNIEHFGR